MIIVELILVIALLVLFYQCCLKGRRSRMSGRPRQDERSHVAAGVDASGGGEPARSARNDGPPGGRNPDPRGRGSASRVTRKELVEKNLFSRRISREESVKELSRILAAARGRSDPRNGGYDEEMGTRNEPSSVETEKASPVGEDLPNIETASTEDSSLPEPSAPSTDSVSIFTVAPRGSLKNLFHEWMQPSSKTRSSHHPLECSICLDSFSPDDVIAWAKDGGDAPPDSLSNHAGNNDAGCDHIFHRDCLVSWLQHHDECPLCRRKVVHADAEARFAGWEGTLR